jgi:hypothetical protein
MENKVNDKENNYNPHIIFKTRLLTTVPKIRTIAEMFVVVVGRARKYDRPKEKRAENPSI